MNGHGGFHYTNDKCRCQVCTEAHAANVRAARYRRAARLAADPSLPVAHGKATTYSNWMCRCEDCTKAWAEAGLKDYRRRQA